MFELSDSRKELLRTNGNLLILGGPGSGKTTIALLKARHEIISKTLLSGQSILFLSFARVTVARVQEQLKGLGFSSDIKKQIEINTYHGFTWNILRSHGYLMCNHRQINLLPPPEAAARLVEIATTDKLDEIQRLFNEEGLLHFDLFAKLCAELLLLNDRLCRIICDRYPIIIFDEFQDTNMDEWRLVKNLGKYSKIIALADPEQRIYDFRGADPARIEDYSKHFNPAMFDFGAENNRSGGRDIAKYGNDIVKGVISKNHYNDVSCIYYSPYTKPQHLDLKLQVLSARRRLIDKFGNDWALAILVPTNKLMLQISDVLSKSQELSGGRIIPAINHDVAVDPAALALAAIIIAGLMEQGEPELEITNRVITNLNDYIRGHKGGSKISQADLKLSKSLETYLKTGSTHTNKPTLSACKALAFKSSEIKLTGNPTDDWLIMRGVLSESSDNALKSVAKDAMFIKLLHKGSAMQAGLADLWKAQGNYRGAVSLLRNVLLQEHFSMTTKIPKGVLLLTIHKAKGKEFEEVILYEDVYNGKFLRDSNDPKDIHRTKLLLRVGVTRAMTKATILTPRTAICLLLK